MYRGMVDCGRQIVAQEGVASLYKGLVPFVTHLTLKYALRFGSFAVFRDSMGSSGASGVSPAPGTLAARLEALKPFLVSGMGAIKVLVHDPTPATTPRPAVPSPHPPILTTLACVTLAGGSMPPFVSGVPASTPCQLHSWCWYWLP